MHSDPEVGRTESVSVEDELVVEECELAAASVKRPIAVDVGLRRA